MKKEIRVVLVTETFTKGEGIEIPSTDPNHPEYTSVINKSDFLDGKPCVAKSGRVTTLNVDGKDVEATSTLQFVRALCEVDDEITDSNGRHPIVNIIKIIETPTV